MQIHLFTREISNKNHCISADSEHNMVNNTPNCQHKIPLSLLLSYMVKYSHRYQLRQCSYY